MTSPSEPRHRRPRVAFFTDSFNEVNGVALTSRAFADFAKTRFYPFFCAYAGAESCHWIRGSYQAYEMASSPLRLGLEHDLDFDLLFLRHLRGVQNALRAFRPDIVHITGPGHLGMMGAILAHQLGVPLVASWHTNVHEFGSRRLERMLGQFPSGFRRSTAALAEHKSLDLAVRFYQFAKMIFAPNPELCQMLGERCGRPVHSMQRGIDCELYTPNRRKATAGRFVIGYVGRISAEKNVRLLAEVDQILKRNGDEFEFKIVGDGSEKHWLQRHMPQATFTGVLKGEALADAYAQMDVLLFPSETDTFGNVVLEAAASGVPSLVSGGGGPKYLVEDGVSGFVRHNAEGYAAAISMLRGSPALRKSMGIAARTSALTRSWGAVFEGIYQQYRNGLAEGILAPAKRDTDSPLPKTFPARSVS